MSDFKQGTASIDQVKTQNQGGLKTYQKLAGIVIVSTALAACGAAPTKPKQVEGSAPIENSSVNTLSVYQEAKGLYDTWLKKLNEAEPLKRYSPDIYKQTLKAWSDAVDVYEDFADDPAKAVKDYSFFSKGTYAERFAQEVDKVEVLYGKLTALKDRADKVLAPSIEQMSYLKKIETFKHYQSEYNSIDEEFERLFSYIEDKEIGDAQNKQSEFLHRAKKLEIKTIRKIYIAPLEQEIKVLKEQGVSLHAAISYAKADAELTLAKQQVEANPRNIESIEAAASKVQFEIDHTTHIAAEVQDLKALGSNGYETYILSIENQLFSISNTLNGTDFRNVALTQQSENILAQIKLQQVTAKPVQAELQQSKADLVQRNQQLEQLQQQVSSLQAQLKAAEQQLQLNAQQSEVDKQRLRQQLEGNQQILMQTQQKLIELQQSSVESKRVTTEATAAESESSVQAPKTAE